MSRALRAVGPLGADRDPFEAALDARIEAVVRRVLGERRSADLLDVLETVPGPRRSIMKAARSGKIRGAVRVGRRWLAPREAINDWLTRVGPRPLAAAKSEDVDDELEPLRRRLLAGGRR